MTFTAAHVRRLAALPGSRQVAVLRSIPRAQALELVAIARGMRRRGMAGLGCDVKGLGFLPIASFLFNAAKVVGTVATTAGAAALTNVLTASKGSTAKQPEQAPPPAQTAQAGSMPGWVIPAVVVGGVVLLAARR